MNNPHHAESDALQFLATSGKGPLGWVRVCANGNGVTRVEFADTKDATERPSAITRLACRQLDEYFAGTRQTFDLPLAAGGTAFQRQVWSALRDIPFGETRSYGQLAAQLGKPSAQRAVGAANGRNPVSIVVPCHRVVGSNGQLTGYAWGVARKRWLLDFERRHLQAD